MRGVAVCLLSLLWSGAALAQTAVEPPQAPAAAVVLPPLEAAVVAAADKSSPSAAGVTQFYRGRQGKPLWLAADGLSPAGQAVVDEIRRADDWGLDARAFRLPSATDSVGTATPEQRAAAELMLTRAVVLYAEHARGGRLQPGQLSLWLDPTPRPVDPAVLLAKLAAAPDPAAELRGLHPRHPQFEALRQAYLKLRAPAQPATETPAPIRIADGSRIKPGQRHPDILLVRKRLGVTAAEGAGDLYDEALETAVRRYLRSVGAKPASVITNQVRTALNRPDSKPAPKGGIDARRLLVNMERWRWLPDDLGSLYVWNNLPEYETRVIKNGKVIHQERIIIGRPDTQTPVFSDRMRFVVFRPEWGIPNSIKVKTLLPRLQQGDLDVLARSNMRILGSGKSADPDRFDWERTDIRSVPIVQEPGGENPLGQMKFMFPNKHDVYMHDTPARHLFNSEVRAFSHGCIRVRNPRRLAEIVFAEASGWTASDVAAELTARGKPNDRIDLNNAIPVHNTYFTVVVNEHGQLKTLPDMYGHDKRMAAVLIDGTSADRIAAQDPARQQQREIAELAGSAGGARMRSQSRKSEMRVASRRSPSFFESLFGDD